MNLLDRKFCIACCLHSDVQTIFQELSHGLCKIMRINCIWKKKHEKVAKFFYFICSRFVSLYYSYRKFSFKSHITFLHKQTVRSGILSIDSLYKYSRDFFCWFFDVVSRRMGFTGNEKHIQKFCSRDKIVFIFNWSFCLMRVRVSSK